MSCKTLTKARINQLADDIKASRARAEIESPTSLAWQKAWLVGSLQVLITHLVCDLQHDGTPIKEAFESDLTDADLAKARAEKARLDVELREWRKRRLQHPCA